VTVTATLPEDLEAELQAELNALEAARDAKGVSGDYLRFCGRVARSQMKARAATRSVVGSAPMPQHAGRPGHLSLTEVPMEDSVLLDLLRDLQRASLGVEREEHLQSLATAADADAGLLRRMVVAATLGDDARPLQDAAVRLGIPAHALAFMARLLAAPFLVEARLRRGDQPELDTRGLDVRDERCPTCSAGPGLAVLRMEDGARRLLCLLCGEAWLAPRLMCAFCGSRDQDMLSMLSVAEDDARWVEICDACRRYLKTVDARLLPASYAVIPRAEDARTLFLDMIAEQEGYVRSAL
jgi:formate dehydrogenase maturation protein FdhE